MHCMPSWRAELSDAVLSKYPLGLLELGPPDQVDYEDVSELTKRVTVRIIGSFPR